MSLIVLAASTRPLAEVFLDRLRSGAGFSRLAGEVVAIGDEEQHLDEAHDDAERRRTKSRPPSPDAAASAILLGRAFEDSRDILAKLAAPDTVAIIQVADPDLVKPIRRMLRMLLASEATLVDGDDLDDRFRSSPTTGSVVVFTDSGKSKVTTKDDKAVAAAMRLGCAVIGIARPGDRLPRALLRIAEHRIVVPPMDADVVASVIEAVTGNRPASIDESASRRIGVNDLAIAVREDLSAERSLARLERLVEIPTDDGPRLSELSGLGEAKAYCTQVVESMREYLAGTRPWHQCPRGLLLSGPPGTGKTSLARALCRELSGSVSFIATSYSAWQSHKTGHLGDVTAAIRETFFEAARRKPCVIYLDECNSIPARGGRDHDAWWTAIVNTLLEMIDGFEKTEGVFLIASCNDPARLDPALVRAGRLDHHIEIGLPDVPGLVGIFRTHLGSDCAGADLREAALAARGHTGADVEKWVRIAREAARKQKRALTVKDLVDAVRGGEPDWPDDLRWRVAYHESGHAIAHMALGIGMPKSLAIDGDGGYTETSATKPQVPTRAFLENMLATILAGRAAEQLKFAETTTGSGGPSARSDLARATNLALRMETAYGFGCLGLVTLAEDHLNDGYLLMTEPLRSATNETLKRAYSKSLALLERNRRSLDALAQALFASSYLDRGEIDAIIARHPLESSLVASVLPRTSASSIQNGGATVSDPTLR
ncbi:AAA family ATPase [Bradyrhizobium yuanmingense]|uniref:AAA family ATPase n=1 Tax=Bradyrhizobium yuanmingense TaxID=108015 RepID=UPI0004BC1DCF|nr:AAA family ATPase [Bradyrhizobium yuanmingense]